MFSQPELTVAVEAARKASQVLLSYFRNDNNKIDYKSVFNLVSQADRESEQVIEAIIRQAFPDHAFLGEESDETDGAAINAEHLWIVDPLDGTNNFCHGLDHFAISIGYYRDGKPNLGVVYRPRSNDWFIAGTGQGAFRNESQCKVAEHVQLDQALIGTGFYYDRGQQMRSTLGAIESLFDQNIHGIRRMGTASLDLCMVGTGQFGGYFEFTLAPWDYAAGKLFAEEAGGVVTNCNGDSFCTGKSSIIAACPGLHAQMLDLIRARFLESRTDV